MQFANNRITVNNGVALALHFSSCETAYDVIYRYAAPFPCLGIFLQALGCWCTEKVIHLLNGSQLNTTKALNKADI